MKIIRCVGANNFRVSLHCDAVLIGIYPTSSIFNKYYGWGMGYPQVFIADDSKYEGI